MAQSEEYISGEAYAASVGDEAGQLATGIPCYSCAYGHVWEALNKRGFFVVDCLIGPARLNVGRGVARCSQWSRRTARGWGEDICPLDPSQSA